MPSLHTSDGVRLNFTEHGDANGRPIVLLAGFKASATSWLFQIPDMTDYRVITVDLRGHGASERPDEAADMELLKDHAQRDWCPTIEKAPFPVLFAAGDDSELWPHSHAAAAAAIAKNGSAVVVPRCGYAANIEQPKAFNAALRDFLSRV